MNLQAFNESETSPAGAAISDCKNYRYLLWRVWSPAKKRLVFIMLNPSTAGEYSDDPTIKCCYQFAAAVSGCHREVTILHLADTKLTPLPVIFNYPKSYK